MPYLKDASMNNLGYACINVTLSDCPKDKRITTNRSMIRATFDKKGLAYASELSLQNIQDMLPILRWNVKNNIHFFRVSSNLFPWASEYSLESLPDYAKILSTAQSIGRYVSDNGIRLTFHPGPFNKLASSSEGVIANTIKDLEIHGAIFDMMGLSRTPYNKINIHVGAAYDSKELALDQFCRNFERLSDSVKSRLTVENDDRPALYSTHELYDGIYKKIGIPIVFDYHHHRFRNDGESELEALEVAMSTWGDVRPVVHYSESRSDEISDRKIAPNAHSDYIYNQINTYDKDIDIMIEAKMKELALLKYRSKFHGVQNDQNRS
jgi:UV DNA damage endonuclease